MHIRIQLEEVGKKFYQRWIFRHISQTISPGTSTVIRGGNGSGKSTLLRIIAGQLPYSEGKITYSFMDEKIPLHKWYQHISWSAPAIDLYPDLSLSEFWTFHFRLKGCLLSSIGEMAEILELTNQLDKKLRFFSSGMLQRAKVGTALFSKTSILLLDEPTSNLDSYYSELLLKLIHTYTNDRTFILASNLAREYQHIDQQILLSSTKT